MANRALLVGINKYRIPGADLNGCVNDVTNVRDVLLKHFLDEILCPHDMDWDGTYIVDDDLKELFSGLPKGVNLEVLLECPRSERKKKLLD